MRLSGYLILKVEFHSRFDQISVPFPPSDVTQYESYNNLVEQVSNIVQDDGLNVLLNNAGIASRTTRLDHVKAEDLSSVFETNAVAPVMMTKVNWIDWIWLTRDNNAFPYFIQAFLPLLKKASAANESKEFSLARATIINMSSILGSIEKNGSVGGYAYRMSKSALNSATKAMSIELKEEKILCIAMHPGWVKTDMGKQIAPLDVETSTQTMWNTLWKMNESHNGTLIQYDGEKLPWWMSKMSK